MLEVNQEWTGKRLELIETAGELFANSGIDGVSIREIAEKSNVNIASINYYFGSKENLYVETLRYVAWQVRCPLAQKILHDETIDYSSKEKCVEIISKLIEERVQNYLSDKYPAWYSRFLLRSLIEPPPKYDKVIFHTFIPELNALVEVLMKCNPANTLAKCRLWAFSIIGEISFYVFAEPGIKLALNIAEKYSTKFLTQLQEHITSLILKGLDLKEG